MKPAMFSLFTVLCGLLFVLCVSCAVSPTAPNMSANPSTTVTTNTNATNVATNTNVSDTDTNTAPT